MCNVMYRYLALGKVGHAESFLAAYNKCLRADGIELTSVRVESEFGTRTSECAPEHPLLGFSQLVVLAVKKSDGDDGSPASRAFTVCKKRYAPLFSQYGEAFLKVGA